MGYVLTGGTVTTGRSTNEPTLLIQQADRSTVELRFCGVLEGARIGFEFQPIRDPTMKFTQFLFRESVVQGQHRNLMLHGAECGNRSIAHPLCRRIISDEIGMFAFDRLQATHQPVVLRIRNLGIIENVILIIVVSNLLFQ